MNQNYNNTSTPNIAVQNSNGQRFVMYGFMILAIVGCFLPFVETSGFLNESINYIYADDKILDGIWIIALVVTAFSSIFKKGNYKGAMLSFGIALALFITDYFDMKESMSELSYGGLIEVNFGLGFYLIAMGLVGALIMTFVVSKNSPANVIPTSAVNVTVNNQIPQPMPSQVQQPVQTDVPQPEQPQTCQYCGGTRNDGMFCKSCGGKY